MGLRVARSSRAGATNGVLAQLVRASALQAEGREFESHILHHDTGVFWF